MRTCAPGTIAPPASFTAPAMTLVPLCAATSAGHTIAAAMDETFRLSESKTIDAPPLCTLTGLPTDQRGRSAACVKTENLKAASHLAIAGGIHTHRHAADAAVRRQQQVSEE